MGVEKVNGFMTTDGKFFNEKEKADQHEGYLQDAITRNKRKQILRDMKLKIGNHGQDIIAAKWDEILNRFTEGGVD